jgi:mannonate dehydratase
MSLEQTWRWYGPNDPVSLTEVKQAGATGIVSALHQVPIGDVWTVEEITERKEIIEAAGLTWSVVESVPVHEDIKTNTGRCSGYIDNYVTTLQNLSACGIKNVCYNFMPVLDWSRTDLEYEMEDVYKALLFEAKEFAEFDLFILKRPGVRDEYDEEAIRQAKNYFKSRTEDQIEDLKKCVLMGLPGGNEAFTIKGLLKAIAKYDSVDDAALRKNLHTFLNRIVPTAEDEGVLLGIHPDDPPQPLLGLPRIVSNLQDAQEIIAACDSPSNGITFCTGSFGVSPDNDLPAMVRALGNRINFVHLRSTERDAEGNFHEANHLEGDGDLVNVIHELVKLDDKRKKKDRVDFVIPMRPDHGHLMQGDANKKSNPGYSGIGRLRGLAEIRGVEMGIRKMRSLK